MFPTPAIGHRANHRAKVISVKEVAPAHYQMKLASPALAKSALPGQFVHISTVPNSGDFTFDPLLRRALSIMSVSMPAKDAVEVLFRVEGRGTRYLSVARENDEIDLIGPLGQPFDVSPFGFSISELPSTSLDTGMFHVKHCPRAIIVGGGVGVPPLVYLCETLKANKIDIHAVIGARTSSDIICSDELSVVCHDVSIATDDGSQGHHGRVTDLLAPLITKFTADRGAINPIVYACGPLPMLRAVAQMCAHHQVRCQVSMEENMPCGIGVCNGCVVRTNRAFAKNDNASVLNQNVNEVVGNEWSPYRAYRRVCVEGPACWADEIDWEHQK